MLNKNLKSPKYPFFVVVEEEVFGPNIVLNLGDSNDVHIDVAAIEFVIGLVEVLVDTGGGDPTFNVRAVGSVDDDCGLEFGADGHVLNT